MLTQYFANVLMFWVMFYMCQNKKTQAKGKNTQGIYCNKSILRTQNNWKDNEMR